MPTTAAITPRFDFGSLVFSVEVDALTRQGQLDPMRYLQRHLRGDWGNVCAEEWRRNDAAVAAGSLLLSSYRVNAELTLCIFTDEGRRLTTVFLPGEY